MEKLKNLFNSQKIKKTKSGYSSQCKKCKKERYASFKNNTLLQLQKEIRSSIQLENKILLKDNKIICSNCKQIYKIEDMQGRVCTECHKIISNKWKKNNIEKIKDSSRRYRENNIEKVRDSVKKCRLKKKLEKLQ